LASDLWPVRVDAVRFDSCLVNLANNARDAMPRGGTLRITTRNARPGEFEATADVAAGDYVAVDVADSGQGIAAESLAQVFDPFYTTKGPGHGTGLGLSMVYGFVKQSNGHIRVSSEVGRGTTVHIYLPRDTAAAPDQADKLAAQPAADLDSGKTVLVVEDNETVRQVAVAVLKSLGHETIEAGRGDEALALLERGDRKVDLILSDVVMPGAVNGYELAKVVRAKYPGIPIVLASGFTGALPNAEETGGVGTILLNKPYRKQELVSAMQTALGTSRTAKSA
jgi:CheY-like chemotaxis protein